LDSEPGYIYYDPEKLWRAREPKEMEKQYKLILSCDYFYVDSIGIYPLFNAVKGKNCYFLTNANEDILYYICGILNSKLGEYYRYETQIDNYERFPIRKIDFDDDKFNILVKETKSIHDLKSDYIKLKNGKTNFKSKFFNVKIITNLDFYPIEDENDYFELIYPKGLGVRDFIESPEISETDKTIIELNKDGLIISCKNEEISKFIFEKYFKDNYGYLSEMDLNINISQLDTKKFNSIEEEIINKISEIERKIDLTVYSIYFDINIIYKNGKILNEKEILSNKFVKKIEKTS